MAVAFSDRFVGRAAPGDDFVSSANVPADATLLYVCAVAFGDSATTVTSVTGAGLTWTELAGSPLQNGDGGNQDTGLAVFIGSGTPTTGVVTANLNQVEQAEIAVVRFSGPEFSAPIDDTDTDQAAVLSDRDYAGSVNGTVDGLAVTFAAVNWAGHEPGDGFIEHFERRENINAGTPSLACSSLELTASGPQSYSGSLTFVDAWFTVYAFTILPEGAATGSFIDPTGIPSGEAFGAAAVDPTIDAAGIPSSEAFGAAAIDPALEAVGIPSAEAFGAAAVDPTIDPAGIASAEAFGAAAIDPALEATGIPSAEAFGAATVEGSTLVTATGIASAEAFGAAVIDPTIDAVGIASAEAFGVAVVDRGDRVEAVGVRITNRNLRAVIEVRDLRVRITNRNLKIGGLQMHWKTNEVGSKLKAQLLDANDAPVPLAGVVGVKVILIKPVSGTRVELVTAIADEATAAIEYTIAAGDLDEAGTYELEVEIDRGGGDVDRVPSKGRSRIYVEAAL